MTDTANLFDKLKDIKYPKTMIGIQGELSGRAFFPGGRGTFDNEETIADKKIMILGQDFDCEANYAKTLKIGHEDIVKSSTWRNLLSFLKDADIKHNQCFYTNAILGIRVGNKGTGKSPAFRDDGFIKECQKFFLYQVELQKPKTILVLGKHVAEFIAPISVDLGCWKRIENYNTLDQSGMQIVKNATFDNGIKSTLVLLTHPSFRTSNIHRRKYLDYSGHDAEVKMVLNTLQ
ncbi:uracil-DNA glycosylase family protein [Parasediminibacterium sp. JCM 36343]|uniref:uracil-DNA glycosylase family protein n=1 Tax=Parasediminibacterium sp. JCM 36343 TaxID=3374279 RepID=UPI00397A3C0F